MSPAGFSCARCGRMLRRTSGERPRKIRCPRCRYLIYDYPRPCAGLIVVKDDAVLLLRRAHAPRKGCLDVPGGFMEANEDIERAARRELKEETGLTQGRVEPLGFYWDHYYLKGFGYFPTMNFYYVGRWRGGEPRAADDAASAEWVPVGRLGRPGARHAWRHMKTLFRDVRRWLRGRRGPGAARMLLLLVALGTSLALASPSAAGVPPDSTQRAWLESRIGDLGEIQIIGPAGTLSFLKPVVREDGIHMRQPYHPPRPALIVVGDVSGPPPVEFVPWEKIDAVQVREGLQPGSTLTGLGIGALIGGLIALYTLGNQHWDVPAPTIIALGAVPGGLIGFLFGAGAQHWRTVYPPGQGRH